MKRSIFHSLFPTPSYLHMASVGLDISDKSIRLLGFTEKDNEVKVGKYADKKINQGIVVSGKINDEQKMKEVLSLLKKEHKLDFIRVSLPEEQGYLFQMNVPLVKKSELRESILFQLEEHVPLKAPNAVFGKSVV